MDAKLVLILIGTHVQHVHVSDMLPGISWNVLLLEPGSGKLLRPRCNFPSSWTRTRNKKRKAGKWKTEANMSKMEKPFVAGRSFKWIGNLQVLEFRRTLRVTMPIAKQSHCWSRKMGCQRWRNWSRCCHRGVKKGCVDVAFIFECLLNGSCLGAELNSSSDQ